MKLSLTGFWSHSIVTSFSLRAAAIAFKTVQIILLVRLYGVELFGVYSIALGVFGLAMVVAQLGLDHFAQREAAFEKRTSYAHLLRISWFLALPGLAVALIALLIVWKFYDPELLFAFAVLVVIAPFYAISWNHIFILRGSGRINLSMVLFEITNPVILMLTAFLLRGSALGLPIAFLAATISTFLLTTFYTHKYSFENNETQKSQASIRSSITHARSFYLTSVLQALQSLADGLIVGLLLRPVDAALYAIIIRMAGLVLMPIAILSMYMQNFVAKINGQPLSEIWRQLRIFTIASASLSMALWALLMALLPFVGAIFNTSFPPEAQWAYVLVVTTRALQGAAASVSSALFMSGREKYISRIHTVLMLPYLGALVISASSQGLIGVGFSLLGYASAVIAAKIYILLVIMKNRSD